jgi:L-threonylcarbamoyladenylate synthase
MLDALVREVSEPAVRLMNAFWPGPLTLVFGAAPGLPSALVGGGETIGVRISSHPVAGALVVQSRCPLTSTSANRSGKLPARSAQEVEEAFGEGIDQILDGGPSTTDLPSTIADVSCGGVKVLREGSIPTEALLRVIGESPPEGAQRVS